MTTDFVVRALGVPVGIVTRGQEDTDRLRRQWSRARCDDAPLATVVLAEHEPDDVAADYALTSAVTMAALQHTRGDRLNLHAGGVADEHGRLLVVVGASGTGKTTAVRLLAERFGYLSDETVSLDPAGPPYVGFAHPKPLSVITDPAQPRRKAQLSPDDLDLRPTPQTAVLHRIVLLRRGRARDEVFEEHGLALVPLSEAVVEMVPQTSSLSRLPAPLLTLAQVLVAAGGAVVLEYEELEDHLEDLIDLMDADLTGDDPWPDPEHAPGAEPGEPAAGRWGRTPWRDAVRLEGDVLVMVGDDVFRLDGLGGAVWWALGSAGDLASLVAAAEAELGAHPDSQQLVEASLRALQEGGLARLGSPA